MNFGEGGAGAYTDGKLGTRIHHPAVRKVVELFARFGGVARILAEGKPHVGSDVLPAAISAMREELERGGCTFLWGARAVDLELADDRFRGLRLADGRTVDSDRLVLAPGNSARELFELFARRGWPLEAKPFAAGFRAEHPQPLIDRIQYGGERRHPTLPPADYKLADNPRVGGEPRAGVFSFCMCPGGVVVPTPTEPEHAVHERDVQLPPLLAARERRDRRGGLAGGLRGRGVRGARSPGSRGSASGSAAAYRLGGGGYRAPAQRLSAYLAGRPGAPPGQDLVPARGHAGRPLDAVPAPVREALRAGLRTFGRRMRGFVTDEALLIGVETRTSAPCRLVRGEDLQSPGDPRPLPCRRGGGLRRRDRLVGGGRAARGGGDLRGARPGMTRTVMRYRVRDARGQELVVPSLAGPARPLHARLPLGRRPGAGGDVGALGPGGQHARAHGVRELRAERPGRWRSSSWERWWRSPRRSASCSRASGGPSRRA